MTAGRKISYEDDAQNDKPTDVSPANPLPVISTPHTRTHEGKFFNTSYLIPHGSELANDAVIDILVITGDVSAHSLPSWNVGGDSHAQIFEDTTVSADGVALDVYNHARWSSNEALLTAFVGPTITDDGTELGGGAFIPGGKGVQAGGASMSFDVEFDMKPNTKYLFRMINRSGASMLGSFGMGFYEP